MLKEVKIQIDRTIGYKDDYGNVYPINYGYVPGIIAGDGEEQDVYIIDTDTPLTGQVTGKIIAIVHRADDIETKWIAVAPENNQDYTKEDIINKIFFIEQYFDSTVEMLET